MSDLKKLTPIGAIKIYCIECKGGDKTEVKKCEHLDCILYPYRTGKNPNRKGLGGAIATFNSNFQKSAVEMAKITQTDHVSRVLSPLLSIRKDCLDCMGGQYKLINECDDSGCAFHTFRFGKKPDK